MPYKNPDKAKEATRERVRRYRLNHATNVTPDSDKALQGVTKESVTPSQEEKLAIALQPPLNEREKKVYDDKEREKKEDPFIPFYNKLSKPGDTCRWPTTGQVFIVPELDADGQPIEAGSPVTSFYRKPVYSQPKFSPAIKPIKKKR